MQPIAALAWCSVLGAHRAAGVTSDVLGSAPFSLNSGDGSYVAVARYTDTMGVACYLGPEVPETATSATGERGRCNLVEGGAVVGDELVQTSDRTLHNAMASLTEATTIWCYADSENSYELKCRKVNRDGTALSVEDSGELSVKGNSVANVLGMSHISVTRFSDDMAVVCSDNPEVQAEAPDTTGPLFCALLFIKSASLPEGQCPSCIGVNSNSGVAALATGPILSLSVISFTADTGAVCYTSAEDDGNRVSCTMIALSGSAEADSTLELGSTVVISEDAANAAATSVSADAGMVCYTEGATASCSKVALGASALSKGEAIPVSQTAISHLTLAAFSNETVAMCFQDGAGGAACNALDVEGGTLGDALAIADAMADQELALMSLTASAGLVCYETSSNAPVCMDLQVLPRTTTTATSTATSTVTTTFATDTSTSLTSTTVTGSTVTTTTLTTDTSTTPHTVTETSITTTPHTTTETLTTTTLAPVVDSGAGRAAGVGCAAASVLVALGLSAL
jgi:hypothetical protein